jgi:hypothetical protein
MALARGHLRFGAGVNRKRGPSTESDRELTQNETLLALPGGSLSDLLFRNGLIGILARGEHSYDRPIPPAPLSFAVLGFGQIGVYGPVATHFKPGDFAPDITFVETLIAPASASRSQPNLRTSVGPGLLS